MLQGNISVEQSIGRTKPKAAIRVGKDVISQANLVCVILLIISIMVPYSGIFFLSWGLNVWLLFAALAGLIIVNLPYLKIRKNDTMALLIALLIFIYIFLVSTLRWVDISQNDLSELFRSMFFYGLCLFCLLSLYYSNYFPVSGHPIIKIYKSILLLSSVILIIQSIFFHIFKINLALPWNQVSPYLFRASGLFGEPAHFGKFCLGLLFLSKSSFLSLGEKKFSLVLVALFLSFSSISYFVLATLIIRFLVSKKIKSLYLILPIVVFLFLLSLFFVDTGQINRVKGSFWMSSGSGHVRVIKGPTLFLNMEERDQLFGFGPGITSRLNHFFPKQDLQIYFSSTFMGGLFVELIGFGFLGWILINFFYYFLFRKSDDLVIKFVAFQAVRVAAHLNMTSAMLMFLLILLISDSPNMLQTHSCPK